MTIIGSELSIRFLLKLKIYNTIFERQNYTMNNGYKPISITDFLRVVF